MWYFMAAGKYLILEYLLFIARFSQRLNRTQKYVQSILYTDDTPISWFMQGNNKTR